jgi:integrase
MPARKPKPRHKKGTVAVAERNGMLRLRWRYLSKPYQIALGMPDTPLNRHLAQGKASEIQADIAYDRFDGTLAKYKAHADDVIAPAQTSAQLFERFIEHRRQEGTSGQAIAARYKPMWSNLQRFGQRIEDVETARAFVDLLRERQSARIANQNLAMLKAFGRWSVEQGLSLENPYDAIKPLKGGRRVQNRRPFTRDEMSAFLATLRADTTYYCYYDFCFVMLSLGVRPSEAIGLRWKYIDFERQQVTICESLARSEDGRTAGYARQRKTTKTVNTRVLPLSQRLVTLLQGRRSPQSQPDDLVFTTVRGKAIDDHNFRERVWRRICLKAGIEYRPPYTTRHTLLSHGIEYEGWTLPQAAQIAGHTSTRMVAETYGHMINQPRLPEF